jgi:hypothetical protein
MAAFKSGLEFKMTTLVGSLIILGTTLVGSPIFIGIKLIGSKIIWVWTNCTYFSRITIDFKKYNGCNIIHVIIIIHFFFNRQI